MYFYINKVSHEVHKSICEYVDSYKYPNVILLGSYDYPSEAIRAAKSKGYSNADGCAYCCPGSHNH